MQEFLAQVVVDEEAGRAMEYHHLIKSKDKRYGVGTRMPNGTTTIYFIDKNKVPKDRKATYASYPGDHYTSQGVAGSKDVTGYFL
eukprot:6943652-Ditylum_brightwellii.AAC.1